MHCLALALAAALMTTQINAQTVLVRSGQHAGFTRLSIDLDRRSDFRVESNGKSIDVIFDDPQLALDTDPVFQRIPRDRILDVSYRKDQSRLRLKLGCDCTVKPFWHGKSLLVFDVSERKPDPRQDTEADPSRAPSSEPVSRLPVSPSEMSNSLAASLARQQLFPEPAPEEETPDAAPPVAQDEAQGRADSIDLARDRLIKQVARATAQGLLSPRDELPRPPRRNRKQPETAEKTPIQDHSRTAGSVAQINLKAQSSMDRDFLAMLDRQALSEDGNRCLSDDMLAIEDWGSDEPFWAQIGPLRSALMAEFDRTDSQIALKLTRLYLFYGFGAEALQTMRMIEGQSEAKEILQAIASIMETGKAPNPNPLSGQMTCTGAAAFWSVMAQSDIAPGTAIDTNAVLRSLDRLPRHLRPHLGADLAGKLRQAGYDAAAETVLRALKRQQEDLPGGAQLVEAEINRAEGNIDAAREIMEDVVNANDEPSASALIRLIDTNIEAGHGVSYDHAILAGAYAQQFSGSAQEPELLRAYLEGLAASGAFDQAYKEFHRLSGTLPDDSQRAVERQLLKLLTTNADDITFLQYTLGQHAGNADHLEAENAYAIADRLLALGFAERAKRFAFAQTEAPDTQDSRLLRARVALALGQPKLAQAELAQISGNEAEKLRADALSQLGEHTAAAEIYATLAEHSLALRESWLAEDPQTLTSLGDSSLADLAAITGSFDTGSPAPDTTDNKADEKGILAQNHALIEESTATREALAQILEARPGPLAE